MKIKVQGWVQIQFSVAVVTLCSFVVTVKLCFQRSAVVFGSGVDSDELWDWNSARLEFTTILERV